MKPSPLLTASKEEILKELRSSNGTDKAVSAIASIPESERENEKYDIFFNALIEVFHTNVEIVGILRRVNSVIYKS